MRDLCKASLKFSEGRTEKKKKVPKPLEQHHAQKKLVRGNHDTPPLGFHSFHTHYFVQLGLFVPFLN